MNPLEVPTGMVRATVPAVGPAVDGEQPAGAGGARSGCDSDDGEHCGSGGGSPPADAGRGESNGLVPGPGAGVEAPGERASAANASGTAGEGDGAAAFNPLLPFTVALSRDPGAVGYGFSVVMEVSAPGTIKHMIVHRVMAAGPAARAGVAPGDMIVLINAEPTAGLQHSAAIALLDNSSGFRLGVLRPVDDDESARLAPVIVDTPPRPGRDTGHELDVDSDAGSSTDYPLFVPPSPGLRRTADGVVAGDTERDPVAMAMAMAVEQGLLQMPSQSADNDGEPPLGVPGGLHRLSPAPAFAPPWHGQRHAAGAAHDADAGAGADVACESSERTPSRPGGGGKKRSLARRFLQLDKVELPSSRASSTTTWKHFLGLDSMPAVIHQIRSSMQKAAVRSSLAACKSKAHELKRMITTKRSKGQETDQLERTLTSVHADYMKTDLLDAWHYDDLQAMGETHAVLLNRTEHGIGMRVVASEACNGVPYLRVSEIVPNGSAHKSGLVRIGDCVLRINGKDMHDVAPKIAIRELKQNDVVALVLGRDTSHISPAPASPDHDHDHSARRHQQLRGRAGTGGVQRASAIPVPVRPPLLSQLSKLEAEIQGRELVLGHINDGLESEVIRHEYGRLGRHVKMLRGMLAGHDKTQRLQQEQRSEIELMREQMREVNRHAAERAAKEQAADVAIIKMLQIKLETLEQEKAHDVARVDSLEVRWVPPRGGGHRGRCMPTPASIGRACCSARAHGARPTQPVHAVLRTLPHRCTPRRWSARWC